MHNAVRRSAHGRCHYHGTDIHSFCQPFELLKSVLGQERREIREEAFWRMRAAQAFITANAVALPSLHVDDVEADASTRKCGRKRLCGHHRRVHTSSVAAHPKAFAM